VKEPFTNAERQARWRAKREAKINQLRLAAGETPKLPRPKSDKPLTNAERQARWRAKREAEIERLRKAVEETRKEKSKRRGE
jgi:hypothetical protein